MKNLKGFSTLAVLGIVLGLIVLGGIGYMATRPSTTDEANRIKEPAISWKFENAGEKENIPYTKVSVTINGTIHEMGSYQGSCAEIGATGGVDGKGLLAGELSAAQCWFAGGGDEIGVFANEGGGLDLMVGALSEGIEGGESFRGDFKVKEII